MDSDLSNDASCYEVASSSKPSAKLYKHIIDNISLFSNRSKHNELSQLELKRNVAFPNNIEKPLLENKPWATEFIAFQSNELNSTKTIDKVGEAYASWSHEFAQHGANASWALEFDNVSSLVEKQSAVDENELDGLFVKFESAWNRTTSWDKEFFEQESSQTESISDPVYEAVWNNHKNISAQYQFEDHNPFLKEDEPFSIGVDLFNNPQGSLTEAALAFEAAIQKLEENSPILIQAWLMLGNCQAENEKEGSALLAYGQSLSIDPNNADTLLALAVSLTNESYDERLVSVLWKWFSVVTNSPSVDISDDREKLTSSLLEAIKQQSSNPILASNLQVALGLLFYNSGSFERSIDCFKIALSISPNDYLLWNRLGATLANSHQSEKAIAMYEKALAIKPSFVRALHNLGVSCMNVGCYEEAAEHLIQALKTQHMDARIPCPQKHISTNLWETLRRNFIFCDRIDLAAFSETRSLDQICTAIDGVSSWIPNPTSDWE